MLTTIWNLLLLPILHTLINNHLRQALNQPNIKIRWQILRQIIQLLHRLHIHFTLLWLGALVQTQLRWRMRSSVDMHRTILLHFHFHRRAML